MQDQVNSPSHYRGASGREVIDVIEMVFGTAGHLPQAIAYILRHKRKGSPIDDLAKAQWYVRRAMTMAPAHSPVRLSGDLIDDICVDFGIGARERARWALRHIFHAMSEDRREKVEHCLSRAEDCLQQAIDDLRASDAGEPVAPREPDRPLDPAQSCAAF